MATKYEYYDTGDNLSVDLYAQYYGAQVYTPQIAHSINYVVLKCAKTASHTGSLFIQIRSVSGSLPTSTVLASGSVTINSLTTEPTRSWKQINLAIPVAQVAGTKYALVAYSNGSSANHPIWRVISVTGTYANGYWCWSTDYGVSWEALPAGRDAMFEEWGDPLVVVKNNYSGGFANAKRLTRMRGW